MDHVSSNYPGPRSKAGARILAAQFGCSRCNVINWWPGALRPFESALSFASRFCELNAISLAQYELFFGIDANSAGKLATHDIQRIASLLDEDEELVQSVFCQPISVSDCVEHRSPQLRNRLGDIQYCPKCIELGYHSYVHEMPWLAKCPFHLVSLHTAQPAIPHSGPTRLKRMKALRKRLPNTH